MDRSPLDRSSRKLISGGSEGCRMLLYIYRVDGSGRCIRGSVNGVNIDCDRENTQNTTFSTESFSTTATTNFDWEEM